MGQGPVSMTPSQLLSRPLHCDGCGPVSGTHVVAPVAEHCSWPCAQMPCWAVVPGCPAVGHSTAPLRTEKRHTPGWGGVRLDPVHSSLPMPFCRDMGKDA